MGMFTNREIVASGATATEQFQGWRKNEAPGWGRRVGNNTTHEVSVSQL